MKWNELLTKAKTGTGSNSEPDAEDKLYSAFTELLAQTILSDQEKKNRIKFLRMRGFQIATTTGIGYEETLEQERSKLAKDALLKRYGWAAYYTSVIARLSERRLILKAELAEVKKRELKYDQSIAERKAAHKELTDEIENLRQQAFKVRQLLVESKNKLGEQIITDAERELGKVVVLQQSMNESSKELYEERFSRNKSVFEEQIKKWTALRAVKEQHLLLISQQIKVLNTYGVNPRVAYMLLGIGYAMAAVAGYFFAVFCSKFLYSSNDAFYYLLKNIISTIAEHKAPIWVKFIYFVILLLFITGITAFVDRQTRKTSKIDGRKKPEKELNQSHRLATGLTLKGLKYAYKTKERRIYLLWLSVMPLALIVGTIVLLLSYGAEIKTQTDELSASTEGLLIGTAMAIGLAAAVYVYIIKIVESRPIANNLSGHVKRNWELALAIVTFLVAIGVFIFYRTEAIGIYSIIGFIGSCLITAFAFSYGLRFLSHLELFRDTNNQISHIDEQIAYYSLPEQLELSVGIDEYFKELGQGMLINLRRKNSAFLNTGNGQPMPTTGVSSSNQKESSLTKFFQVFGRRTDHSTDESFLKVSDWELSKVFKTS